MISVPAERLQWGGAETLPAPALPWLPWGRAQAANLQASEGVRKDASLGACNRHPQAQHQQLTAGWGQVSFQVLGVATTIMQLQEDNNFGNFSSDEVLSKAYSANLSFKICWFPDFLFESCEKLGKIARFLAGG